MWYESEKLKFSDYFRIQTGIMKRKLWKYSFVQNLKIAFLYKVFH